MEGTVLIQRICGHSSPYTFKKNERYGKQRFEKFISKKCPACTMAAIKALEDKQKVESRELKKTRQQQKQNAEANKAAES